MEYREIGSTGIRASAVALGTWAAGGGSWWDEGDDNEAIQAIHASLDKGINLIDTAPVYGFGKSEEIVGKAIAGRRSSVILATKCGLWWHDQRGTEHFRLDGRTVRRHLRPETIRLEVEMSLQRLGTDYIDLYQTHWPSLTPEKEPVADTMAYLMKLKDEGKIRAIGASNVDSGLIEEYLQTGMLDAVQMRYSMIDRHIEEELLPCTRALGISMLAYSPLEQGLLSGRFTMDYRIPEGSTRHRYAWFRPENRRKVLDMLSGWNDLAEKYDSSLSALVIAWTAMQPGITFVLCGARRVEHALANARAGDLLLEPEDMARMRRDALAIGEPS